MLRIGALATYTDIVRSRLVVRHLPMLVAAAAEIGAIQIQNRGTIGGNLANASPAGDTLPVLAAAEALVELQSAEWMRKVPFGEFYTGYRKSVMRPDELITAVEIPTVEGVQFFRKVGLGLRSRYRRSSWPAFAPTVPASVLAAWRRPSSVCGAPRRRWPLARPWSDAQRILQTEIAPIDDLRSTAAYRRRLPQTCSPSSGTLRDGLVFHSAGGSHRPVENSTRPRSARTELLAGLGHVAVEHEQLVGVLRFGR